MQFMSNYTSAAAFRRPLEKQNGERENEQNRRIFWLKNKLLTSTFYTGPGGMSKVKPKPPKKRRKKEKGGNIQKEISPVTHSRVRDHSLGEKLFLKKRRKRKPWRDRGLPARLWRPLRALAERNGVAVPRSITVWPLTIGESLMKQ